MGDSSANDYFRQLFANDGSMSEVMFFGKRTASLKPDNISTGSHALAKRECYFAYIPGHSPMGSAPETPIVVFPLVSGKFIFDYEQCKTFHSGKAVILRADNSVLTLPVDKSGHVFINGKDLFDPTQPFWGGKVPVVKWPE